jgi:hypothetical protein
MFCTEVALLYLKESVPFCWKLPDVIRRGQPADFQGRKSGFLIFFDTDSFVRFAIIPPQGDDQPGDILVLRLDAAGLLVQDSVAGAGVSIPVEGGGEW